MFFTINLKLQSTKQASCYIKYIAKKYIVLTGLGATELALDDFCMQNYKKSLKHICLYLVKKCTITRSGNNFIITFIDSRDDNLASLITYGNGKLFGSKILRNAFK